MTVTRARFLTFVAAIVAAAVLSGAAQQTSPAPAATASLGQAIPPDPQITIGSFPNGLKYYIRTNKKPEGRAGIFGMHDVEESADYRRHVPRRVL